MAGFIDTQSGLGVAGAGGCRGLGVRAHGELLSRCIKLHATGRRRLDRFLVLRQTRARVPLATGKLSRTWEMPRAQEEAPDLGRFRKGGLGWRGGH